MYFQFSKWECVKIRPLPAKPFFILTAAFFLLSAVLHAESDSSLSTENPSISEEKVYPGKETDTDALYKEGLSLTKEGEVDAAKELFLKVIAKKPDFAEAHYYLGMLQAQSGEADNAIASLEQAIRLGVNDANVYYLLSAAYSAKGNLETAKGACLKAIERNPKMMSAYHDLGVLYYRTNETEKAVEALKQALLINPSSSKTMLMLGLSYVRDGKRESAMEYVTALREAGEESKAAHLEGLIRQAAESEKFVEPDPSLLTPQVPPPPQSGTSRGKVSMTGTAHLDIKAQGVTTDGTQAAPKKPQKRRSPFAKG